jgi:hypothetical protein
MAKKKFTMTWEPSKLRWRKMYRKKVYTISCDALDCPGTKEGSYRQANSWWESQFSKLKTPPTRFDHVIEELERKKAWLVHHKEPTEKFDRAIEMLREMANDPNIHPSYANLFVNGAPDINRKRSDPSNSHFTSVVPMETTIWNDRLSRFEKPPTERTVGYWIEKFLAMRETEVKSGDLSVSSYESIKLCLDHFSKWLNPELPIDNLDASRWIEWYMQLQSLSISIGYKRKRFIFARTFISWLIEQGLIPGFASLFARRYKFGKSDKEVEPLSVEKVRAMVESTNGILRLHLLLMLNTGMTQKDISDLKPSEYKEGRITRRRSKTANRNTRIVSWKLWDVTRDLLDQFKQEGSHLLLTQSGKAWVRDELIDGKRKKTDSIKSIYRLTKINIPLKRLRQTSGDMIKKKFSKDVADHFLAHGREVVDQSYFSEDQKRLDAAVAWLGKEYGLG